MKENNNTMLNVLLYLLVLLLIPLIIEKLFSLTIRKNRATDISFYILSNSLKKNKPILIFNQNGKGYLVENNSDDNDENIKTKTTEFTGDIFEIINSLKENSTIIVFNGVIEYDNEPLKLINLAMKVSGGDLYIIGFEKNSTRPYMDDRMKIILDKPYYMPNTIKDIKWSEVKDIHKYFNMFYGKIIRNSPNDFFDLPKIEKLFE